MKSCEIERRVTAAAQSIIEFVEDRLHRWTKELSDAKSGADSILTNKKRELTRNIFYDKVGAGSPLSTASTNEGYYVNSINSYEGKTIQDHVLPPQLLGEFFLDKLCGYYTEKDTSILTIKEVSELIKNCFKVIEVPDKSSKPSIIDGKKKSINVLLSYHSCYSQQAINNPEKYIPIVISQKYKYLNECSDGVLNSNIFKGNLTIMRDNRKATDEELSSLFGVIEGFDEWQVEKYNAKSFGPNSIISLKNNTHFGTLEAFM
tara:strand:- start:122 stop:904 length:783 start_codon:yes stop_codon:yes gene_type:complete